VTKRMGAKKLALRKKVKPFIKVRLLYSHEVFVAYTLTSPGGELPPPVSYKILGRAGGSERYPIRRILQRGITAGGLKEASQEIVRRALLKWEEQVVLPTAPGMWSSLVHSTLTLTIF